MARPMSMSRGWLADFLVCQRRFQLRYQRRLAWPAGPLDGEPAGALHRGRRFHQLLQRHFLGLPSSELAEDEPELAQWWRRFQSQGPRLPAGKRLPEFSLTVPIGRHFLTGRYDLLIEEDDRLHIYDWKTGMRPRSLAALRDELQTRVYLAIAAEGAPALWPHVRPEAIQLTYWYASEPPVSRTLAYDAAWHAENWAGLVAQVGQIEHQLVSGEELPLTDDVSQCRRCAYQAFCGRQVDGMDQVNWPDDETSLTDEESVASFPSLRLEPEHP